MRDIDQLIETAFERNSSDVDLIRKTLGGADLAEFDSLLNLKSDLKGLRDVPDCQLTVDHLRRAVLNQKPAQSSKSWLRFWVFAPVATAAALALVFVVKSGSLGVGSAPQATLQTPIKGSPVAVVVPPVSASTEAGFSVVREPVTRIASISPNENRVRRSVRRLTNSGPVAARSDLKMASTPVGGDIDEDVVSTGALSEGTELAMTVPESVSANRETDSRDSVVVILDKRNPETGAAEAREISKPSDVVFGG